MVLEHQAFKRPVQWELTPFADVGAVFGADDAATAAAPSLPVHPSVGLGVRPIFDEIMVGRVDVAVGADLVERGGAVVMDPSLGFYLMFEHPF